jgi:hypothetical protein
MACFLHGGIAAHRNQAQAFLVHLTAHSVIPIATRIRHGLDPLQLMCGFNPVHFNPFHFNPVPTEWALNWYIWQPKSAMSCNPPPIRRRSQQFILQSPSWSTLTSWSFHCGENISTHTWQKVQHFFSWIDILKKLYKPSVLCMLVFPGRHGSSVGKCSLNEQIIVNVSQQGAPSWAHQG